MQAISYDVLSSLVISNQQVLNSLLGFWVAIWLFLFTILAAEKDPKRVGIYKRLATLFAFITIELFIAEAITACALAFKSKAMSFASLSVSLIIFFTAVFGTFIMSKVIQRSRT